MKLDILVAVAVVLSSLFFVIGYALNLERASTLFTEYFYIDLLFLSTPFLRGTAFLIVVLPDR